MQFFSEDYLMHYGVKGMKWKKKHGLEDDRPGDHVAPEASDDYEGPVEELRKRRQRELAIQRIREQRGRTSEVNYRRLRAKFDQSRQKSYDAEKGRAGQYAKKSSGFYRTQEWKDTPHSAVNTGDDRDYVHARMFKKRGR